MPETSVHEYHRTVLAEYNVGRARQPLHIDTETETTGKEITANHHLRFRVLAADAAHAVMPLLGSHLVHNTIYNSVKIRF